MSVQDSSTTETTAFIHSKPKPSEVELEIKPIRENGDLDVVRVNIRSDTNRGSLFLSKSEAREIVEELNAVISE